MEDDSGIYDVFCSGALIEDEKIFRVVLPLFCVALRPFFVKIK